MNTQQRGLQYELAVIDILRRQGFTLKHLAAADCHDSDLELADGVRVEVKGSVPHKINQRRQGYAFMLHRFGMNAPIDEAALILYCQTPAGPECFVIPTELTGDVHLIVIAGCDIENYRGKWACYRNAFTLLDELGAKRRPSKEA
jgi:hypothetical protein